MNWKDKFGIGVQKNHCTDEGEIKAEAGKIFVVFIKLLDAVSEVQVSFMYTTMCTNIVLGSDVNTVNNRARKYNYLSVLGWGIGVT